jgi:hypothetical protein
MYRDGVAVPVSALVGENRGDFGRLQQPTAARLGAQNAGPNSLQRFFRGQLGELTLYDRALSAQEIQSIFAAGAVGKCRQSVCSPGEPTVVDDDNDCTADTCDPVQGVRHSFIAPSSACNDGNACTLGDSCDGSGRCNGAPISADDSDACTADSCDPVLGVRHTPLPDGAACSAADRCRDHLDSDGDQLVDCIDPDCTASSSCLEICDNTIDDNEDGRIDCADPRCQDLPRCQESLNCSDGVDNDADSRVDCADADCTASDACPETCDNGTDDDGNGHVDCADVKCAGRYECREDAHCDDGLDNDRDGSADCADEGCSSEEACIESAHCRDHIDNDRDGRVDCADDECAGGAPCIAEICGNMVDDDGDGMFDCADPECRNATGCNDVPPPFEAIAPALPEGSQAGVYTANAFLFAGPSPIQYFVEAGTIEAGRSVVLQGRVRTGDGTPTGGVLIRILHHPEYGETRTNAEGAFAMVVNGGATLSVEYTYAGYIPVQRQVSSGWGEYAFVDEVVLTAFDTRVTAIDVSGGAGTMQVARGSVATDADGSRAATLMFPSGVGAQMVMADGSTLPLATLSVRATELTVGVRRPERDAGRATRAHRLYVCGRAQCG